MAVLSESERALVHKLFMARGHVPPTLLKADVRAAVNAADDWVDLNAAAFNLTLPQPFRGDATTAQKAIILAYCALRRAGITL